MEHAKHLKQSLLLFATLLYGVGIVLLVTPQWRVGALAATPQVLLLTTILLLLSREGRYTHPLVGLYLGIVVVAYLVEVVGVNSGLPFGRYSYGTTLGGKFWNTPPLIGVNWLYMVVATRSVATQYNLTGVGRVCTASLMMLLYDTLLEQVAPCMGMWMFGWGVPPISNYLSWLALSLLFHIAAEWVDCKAAPHYLALPLLALQTTLFFVQLMVCNTIWLING